MPVDVQGARVAIDDAIAALSIELYSGHDPENMDKVSTPEASIAISLDRVDRALGPAGHSMFAALAQNVTHAMIALHEARTALQEPTNG